ncbi:Magnesium chelatase [Vulcanisaeta distributa DSM 14429]|uniref:Magnesium chelatase n=2 Tax=Vulcanisaeta distributa TaxID=164451 RepID=E1QNI7_VULDI|nr:Magnesium chelatase [Vulcanisaeta distributa DSM 14429]
MTEGFYEALNEALSGIDDVEFNTIYLESYDIHEVSRQLSAVARPDIALLSLMGDHPELLNYLGNWLREAPVVITLSTGLETVMLTRIHNYKMGDYLIASLSPRNGPTQSINYFDPKTVSHVLHEMSKSLPNPVSRHLKNWALLIDYWRNWRRENIINMVRLVLREYCGIEAPAPRPPIELGDYWIEDDEGNVYHGINELMMRRRLKAPFIVLLAYSGQSYDKARKVITHIMRGRADVVPLLSNYGYTLRGLRELLSSASVGAILNLQWFRLVRNREDSDVLPKFNVPVMSPVVMYGRDADAWVRDPTGLSPIEVIYAVAMPEVDGAIEPIPIAGLVNRNGVKAMEVIQDRVDRVLSRADRWLTLRQKPNADKRIAIIIYNYPPGEENIGRASYLDTLKSVEVLLRRLSEEGFRVKPVTADTIKEFFVRNPNSGRWSAGANYVLVDRATYMNLFSKLRPELRERIIKQWGEPPGNVMTRNGGLALPVLDLGNVVIVLQPSRGWHEDPSRIYHDSELYPHHQYVALYRWLEEVWHADAVIHVGTHGTLEFLPGKQVGLSSSCPPDALLGNLPNVYIYHVVVVGEGTIAKRRSYAVLISHLSPRITEAGLNNELKRLRDLIDEYREANVIDKPRASAVLKSIESIAGKYGLEVKDLEALYDELMRMERSAMPYGLRVLGVELSDDEVVDYLTLALRRDRGVVKSLHRLLAEAMGYDYDDLLEHPGKYANILRSIDKGVRRIVRALIVGGVDSAIKVAEEYGIKGDDAKAVLNYARDVVERLRLSPKLELKNVIRALNGEYIPAGVGGDYVMDSDVLPAGRNFYALDPLKIPSESALELGARIAEESIKRYLEQYGRYPEAVGIVVWGGQESRTRGVSIGQALRYLGVKLIHRPGSWDPRLEVIPIKDLGRPRIDVVVTMSGVFRDMFPHLISLINKAVRLVAGLDEPVDVNYVRKHYLELRNRYGEASLVRTFSERPGDYGNKVNHLVETSRWRADTDIASVYTMYMGFGYDGDMRGMNSNELKDLFKALLSRVDVTSQVQSSVDYSIIDIDDYYAYLGGLSKSVEVYSGKRPLVLYTDLTQDRPRMMNVRDAVGFYVRTRLLNPKWIEGMRRHGYMGAQNISKRVEYVLGLAATMNAVDDWVWDRVAETYVFSDEMRRWFIEVNPYALEQIIKRLYEAYERGLWHTSEDVIRKLRDIYAELEGVLEGVG